ncbi:MAG: CBS domain-containing protein [Bacillota bacterium]|nr:CBS domain-containing protein [Bacillota bacterium]
MFVRKIMIDDVVSVPDNATLDEARAVMEARRLRAVPVVHEGRPVGVLELLELHRLGVGHPSPEAPGTRLVSALMQPAPPTVTPDTPFEEAAARMAGQTVSFLPVVDDRGLLVGVVTRDALFRQMLHLLGWDRPDIPRLALLVPEQPGQVERIGRTVREMGGNITHMATDRSETFGLYTLLLRIQVGDFDRLVEALERQGFRTLDRSHPASARPVSAGSDGDGAGADQSPERGA